MKASTLAAFGLVALITTQGCNFKFGRGGRPDVLPEMGLETSRPTDRDGVSGQAYGLKQVKGKQEPTSLIARDGTTCTASKEKFDSAIIGRSVWCNWIDQRR